MTEAQFIFNPPKEPAKIGVIEVDVLVETEFSLDSEVSEYPVEDGFPISDNVTARPIKLSMVVMISPLPVTYYEKFKDVVQDRVSNCIDEFYKIYEAREPITVVTHQRVWENMVMVSCPIRRSKEDGIALKVAVDFVQIRKVNTKTEQIPAEFVEVLTKGKADATKADAGDAGSTTIDVGSGGSTDAGSESESGSTGQTEKRGSILHGLLKR